MKKLFTYLLLTLMILPLPAIGETHDVLIMENAGNQSLIFKPLLLKVEVGDSVTFRSELAGHVTQSVFVPDGANTWGGPHEEKASVTLNKEGIYIYECRFHGNLGMVGIIQVGKANNLDAAKTFYHKYKKKFIVNKDRLDNVINNIK